MDKERLVSMSRGLFISVEGIEGVGKSTAIEYIREWFNQAGIDHILTREPGGTPLAEDIRQLLLSPGEETVEQSTELLLMFASRAQNVHRVILPALQSGRWVLADRFTDASIAYQGAGRGISLELIDQLADFVHARITPDLTLLLDAPVEVGMQRIAEKNDVLDRIELEQHEFFDRVRQQYLDLAKEHAARYRVIDASCSLQDVHEQIGCVLRSFMEERG
jgi:dTMP kinase